MSHSESRPAAPERGVRLMDVYRFLRHNWWVILGPAVAVAAVTVLGAILLIPPSYEASSVLVIAEPRYASELKPPVLTVQFYQNLLESDAVIAEAKRRLQAQGQLKRDELLRRGEEVETRIFVSRRAEETSLAPMIQLLATGRTPAQAAAIANTWAAVFLERVRQLTGDATASTVRFIDGQYPQTLERLALLEESYSAAATESQQRYDNAATRWDGKISAFKKESADLSAAYRSESRRLLEEFLSQGSLETRRVQLATMRKGYTDIQAELGRVDLELQQKQLLLESARNQLKETPEFITLQKSMSDDAMWQEVTQSQSAPPDWDKLRDKTLRTQSVNPIHTEIRSRVLQLEMELNAAVPRKEHLIRQLAAVNEELSTKEAALRTDDARLEKLQQERDAGLEKLHEDRGYQLAILNRDRQQELDALKREGQVRLGQIERTINQQKGLFDELLRKYNQALLAKAQQDTADIRLGAPAVAPDGPRPRGLAVLALLGVLVGGLAGLCIAFFREASATEVAEARQ